ncbi:uncharacterized protein DS421_12g359100 [Arachis hypogaea]|nr:uncharacterized protein DS421_12g359100 [Arachis hypogaea]
MIIKCQELMFLSGIRSNTLRAIFMLPHFPYIPINLLFNSTSPRNLDLLKNS